MRREAILGWEIAMSSSVGQQRKPDASRTSGAPRAQEATPDLAAYMRSGPDRGTTTETVTEALREAILDGALRPSRWLREDEVAKMLKVSRTPVREALSRLADEGLVEKRARLGAIVAGLSFEDVLALYVVRESLEGLVARLAALRSSEALLRSLEASQRRMAQAVRRNRTEDVVEENLEFHRILRAACNNSYLERFLTQVEHAVRRLPTSTLALPGRATETLAEHEAIIDCIRNENSEGAEVAARQHMAAARELRLRMMLGFQPST